MASRTKIEQEIHEIAASSGSPSPFEEAKAQGALLEKEVDAADVALRAFPRGPTGGVPDDVRATPEFRAANARFREAFARLRAFNSIYVKRFAKELKGRACQALSLMPLHAAT